MCRPRRCSNSPAASPTISPPGVQSEPARPLFRAVRVQNKALSRKSPKHAEAWFVVLAAIDEIFRDVEAGSTDFGVVPVENSTEGMVNHTLDCFLTSKVKICAEVELAIHHALLRHEAASGDITEIRSHAQSLAQCRGWLDRHYPGVPRVAVARAWMPFAPS